MYICNRFEWLKETVEKKITTFATTNTIAVLLSIRKAIGNVHEIEIQENARKERRREVEENYKAIWKDFPLFPFSFNRTIISFVIKYHLSSRLLFSAQVCVCKRERERARELDDAKRERVRGGEPLLSVYIHVVPVCFFHSTVVVGMPLT